MGGSDVNFWKSLQFRASLCTLACLFNREMGEKMASGFPYEQWFMSYREMGGTHDRTTFNENEVVFEALTREAFRFRNGCRNKAYESWVSYIGCEAEARRYFSAIDSVTPRA